MSIFGKKGPETEGASIPAPDIAISVRVVEDGGIRTTAIYTSKGTELLKDGGNRARILQDVGRLLKQASEQVYGREGSK